MAISGFGTEGRMIMCYNEVWEGSGWARHAYTFILDFVKFRVSFELFDTLVNNVVGG